MVPTLSAIATKAGPYRPLRETEIAALVRGGCTAGDWGDVKVAETFDPAALRSVAFSGPVRLGALQQTVTLEGGVEVASGITNAALCDCTIGHNVFIRNVGRHLAHLDVGDDVVIDNVGLIAADPAAAPPNTAFGSGVRVEALNEAGGRSVLMFDRLSSQMAYILALYRHRRDVVDALDRLIVDAVHRIPTQRASIGRGARILDSGSLVNVRVGESAVVAGALRLSNGTIHSSPAAPTRVGEGVTAECFLLAAGSAVESGAWLSHVFVGQGARLGRNFSAQHSLVFANSELSEGEACSVLAGPYTVSHHKSSLLIAGLYSFFNAGSGTNHSNHMYKLGPLHSGVLERGCKTGSSAYVLWPARVGAFTVILGRHAGRIDTAIFPFSQLREVAGKSVLIPGANFYTCGTRRDAAKWPARDRRTDPDQLDLVRFEPLNPVTVGRMIEGRSVLRELAGSVHPDEEFASCQGVSIPCSRLHKGAGVYEMAIQLYLGEHIAERIERLLPPTAEAKATHAEAPPAPVVAGDSLPRSGGELIDDLLRCGTAGRGAWVDLCGMVAPQSAVDNILDDVAAGKCDLAGLEAALRELHQKYAELQWEFVVMAWLAELQLPPDRLTLHEIETCVQEWKAATLQCNNWVLRDAEGEFTQGTLVGYGIDDPETAIADFQAVRGTFQQHSFVRGVLKQNREVTARADELLRRIRRLTV
ncbi:MAG: DUF4954 family protein [Planctomycetia bacterium]|nr:DUF4954 family protein [Planctomycetia bacterium]